jgi:hypothetical protein
MWEKGDPIPEDTQKIRGVAHLFTIKVKNVGVTPGVVSRYSLKYVLLDKKPETLAGSLEYGTTEDDEYLLVPNDEFWLTATLEPATLTKSQVASIRAGELFLFAYGLVLYEDAILHERHETRFGFTYHFPQGGAISFEKNVFRHDGPPEYNHAT